MVPVIDTCDPSTFTRPPPLSTVSLRASSVPLTVSGPVLVMTRLPPGAPETSPRPAMVTLVAVTMMVLPGRSRVPSPSNLPLDSTRSSPARRVIVPLVRSSVPMIVRRRLPTSMIDPGVTGLVPVTTQGSAVGAQRSSAVVASDGDPNSKTARRAGRRKVVSARGGSFVPPRYQRPTLNARRMDSPQGPQSCLRGLCGESHSIAAPRLAALGRFG